MSRSGPADGGAWLVWLERVLWSAGAVALACYVLAQAAAAREQASLSEELERHVAAPPAGGAGAGARTLPERGALVGRVELPRLRLSAMAREGVDTKTLGRAVGHVPSTAMPGDRGNAAFAGHRDTFFRKLQDVRRGDAVYVTTTHGRYKYVVRDTRVVKPSDVWVLDPTEEPTLTLVTCYPFNYLGSAPERFIVRASLEDTDARTPAAEH